MLVGDFIIDKDVGGGGIGGGVLLQDDEELGDEEVELTVMFFSVENSKLCCTGPLNCFS